MDTINEKLEKNDKFNKGELLRVYDEKARELALSKPIIFKHGPLKVLRSNLPTWEDFKPSPSKEVPSPQPTRKAS